MFTVELFRSFSLIRISPHRSPQNIFHIHYSAMCQQVLQRFAPHLSKVHACSESEHIYAPWNNLSSLWGLFILIRFLVLIFHWLLQRWCRTFIPLQQTTVWFSWATCSDNTCSTEKSKRSKAQSYAFLLTSLFHCIQWGLLLWKGA